MWGAGFLDKDVCAWKCTGCSWCYQENTVLLWYLNLRLLVGRELWIFSLLQIFFFLMLLLFCKKSILQNSCWSGFSWRSQNGVADRARALRLPRSALLPATCASFSSLLIDKHSDLLKVSVDTSCKCLLSSLHHVVLLFFNILIDVLDLSLIWKTCPPLSKMSCPSKLQRWFTSLQHFSPKKNPNCFSGIYVAHSAFQDQILLVKQIKWDESGWIQFHPSVINFMTPTGFSDRRTPPLIFLQIKKAALPF